MNIVRETVARHLPAGASLRRDSGSALYVTNAPRLGFAGGIPGFRVELSGDAARIYIEPETMESLDFPVNPLAERMAAFKGSAPETLELFTRIIKCREAGDISRLAACEREVRKRAAVALRAGGGEGLYYCARALPSICL